jgi:C4-type Zn-finger protein
MIVNLSCPICKSDLTGDSKLYECNYCNHVFKIQVFKQSLKRKQLSYLKKEFGQKQKLPRTSGVLKRGCG